MVDDANLMVMVVPMMDANHLEGDNNGANTYTSDQQNNGNNPASTQGKKKRKSPTKRTKKTPEDGDTPTNTSLDSSTTPKSANKAPAYRKMTDPERYHVFAAAMQAKALHGSIGANDQQYSKEMYNTTIDILEKTVELHGLQGQLMPGYTTIRGLLTKFYNTGYVSREVGGGGCLRWGCRLSGKGTGGKCLCHQRLS